MMYSSAPGGDGVCSARAAPAGARLANATTNIAQKTARNAFGCVVAERYPLRKRATRVLLRIAHSPEEESWLARLRMSFRVLERHVADSNDRTAALLKRPCGVTL